jgi:hypothetical protein
VTEAEARAAAWLQAWDAQGTHRTGTPGDRAGADWLAGEAAELGGAVTIEAFALDRLDPALACLEFAGELVTGIPVFDAPATGLDGVEGRLGPIGADAEIAIAELGPRAVYSGEFERLRKERRASRAGRRVQRRGTRPGPAQCRGLPCSPWHAGDPCI